MIDDADDLGCDGRGLRGLQLNTLSDWIGAGPQLLRQPVVDDDARRPAWSVVLGSEVAAGAQRDAQRVEVARQHHRHRCVDFGAGVAGRDALIHRHAIEWYRGAEPHLTDARSRSHGAGCLLIEREPLGRRVELTKRELELHGQDS